MHTLFFALSLLACTGSPTTDKDDTSGMTDSSDSNGGDSNGGDSNGGDSNGGDSNGGDTNAVCNTDNEDCTARTCNGDGVNMLPGADCLVCHTRGGAEEAPTWTAGGTLFSDSLGTDGVQGATVTITDSTGAVATMTTSQTGNFYWSRSLTPPLRASVTTGSGTVEMTQEVNTGACNSCHMCEGQAGGKMYAP